jgi:hypothetical protein
MEALRHLRGPRRAERPCCSASPASGPAGVMRIIASSVCPFLARRPHAPDISLEAPELVANWTDERELAIIQLASYRDLGSAIHGGCLRHFPPDLTACRRRRGLPAIIVARSDGRDTAHPGYSTARIARAGGDLRLTGRRRAAGSRPEAILHPCWKTRQEDIDDLLKTGERSQLPKTPRSS